MAKFCSECGTAVTEATEQFCPECCAEYVHAVPAPATAFTEVRENNPPQPVEANSHVVAPPGDFTQAHDDSQPQQRADFNYRTESAPPEVFARSEQSTAISDAGTATSELRRGNSAPPQRSLSQSQSIGLLKSRYSDHPNCDVCNIAFDVTKRRHQCRRCGVYVCSSCSPQRLLIPLGQQVDDAKGYDQSIPQIVCLHCASELKPLQAELVFHFAKANQENIHEARGRLHLPYTESLAKECKNAADILGNFFRDEWGAGADRTIPLSILQKAKGLAILTIAKAGFMFVGKIGTGLVVARLADGSWSAPSAIGTLGLGWGLQIGGELVEIVLVLGSEGAVEVFHKPQANIGAGLDVTVGPFGRAAGAAAALSSNSVNANYSYSHSKGLYAGISLQGSVIVARKDMNRKFYGRDLEPSELLSGSVGQPQAAKPLYDALNQAMEEVNGYKEILAERSALMGPCQNCDCQTHEPHVMQQWNKRCKTCSHVH